MDLNILKELQFCTGVRYGIVLSGVVAISRTSQQQQQQQIKKFKFIYLFIFRERRGEGEREGEEQ